MLAMPPLWPPKGRQYHHMSPHIVCVQTGAIGIGANTVQHATLYCFVWCSWAALCGRLTPIWYAAGGSRLEDPCGVFPRPPAPSAPLKSSPVKRKGCEGSSRPFSCCVAQGVATVFQGRAQKGRGPLGMLQGVA